MKLTCLINRAALLLGFLTTSTFGASYRFTALFDSHDVWSPYNQISTGTPLSISLDFEGTKAVGTERIDINSYKSLTIGDYKFTNLWTFGNMAHYFELVTQPGGMPEFFWASLDVRAFLSPDSPDAQLNCDYGQFLTVSAFIPNSINYTNSRYHIARAWEDGRPTYPGEQSPNHFSWTFKEITPTTVPDSLGTLPIGALALGLIGWLGKARRTSKA